MISKKTTVCNKSWSLVMHGMWKQLPEALIYIYNNNRQFLFDAKRKANLFSMVKFTVIVSAFL